MWLVTGASGFVGSHVLAELGGDARGLFRRDLPTWDVPNLRRALEGVSGVVHAASVVHKPSTPAEEYERFNVEGTRALLEAARAAGVRRFVFVSSIKVHGESPAGVIDERTPVLTEAHYARTKAVAEELVLAASDLHPVVLRLCPVYGRGDKGNVRTMIRSIARRRFFVPGDGTARKSIVHVSTVAAVASAALTETAEGTFVVSDRHTPSIRALADAIARQLGRRPPVAVPRRLLRSVAAAVGSAARLARVSTPISGELIDKAMTSSVCDPSRVERELGVSCSVDLDATLADEIAWLRETGRL
ncbi:MAG: NAD-dependent epimerase/dehydratase family protein [Labilithrix sp.]|nr:NAD-dependent epimerase/dehydratase family protein [Labilithrix sp.]